MFIAVILYTIFTVLSTIAVIAYIGKDRPPITHGTAIVTLFTNAGLIMTLWWLYGAAN